MRRGKGVEGSGWLLCGLIYRLVCVSSALGGGESGNTENDAAVPGDEGGE